MAITIYKAISAMLSEDMESQMKRKKDVELVIVDLQEKLNMLQQKVQEREAREARIELRLSFC